MERNDNSAAMAAFIGEQAATQEERSAFDRKVAGHVAASALVKELEAVREQQGLSKAELGRRMGVKASVVSRLLAGQAVNPTLSTVADVADALGVYLEIQIKPQPCRARHVPIEVRAAPLAA